jgi:hypothetical protein
MTRHFAKLAIVALVGGVLLSRAAVAQILPPAQKAEHVKIIKGSTTWLLSGGPVPILAGTTSISQWRITARLPVT